MDEKKRLARNEKARIHYHQHKVRYGEWYQNNKKRLTLEKRERYATNIEEEREKNALKARKWRRSKKEHMREYRRRWKKNNPLKQIASEYRCRARKDHIVFSLTTLEINNLVQQPCAYCGSSPLNGIDRVDSDQGYIQGNCVSCCKYCNMMKRDYSFSFFREHIRAIHSHLNKNPYLTD